MKTLPRLALAAAVLALSAHAAAIQLLMTADAAYQEMRAGKPFAGMPNLDKPVYVIPGSLICNKPGALGNPNVRALLMTGLCFASATPIRVDVIRPQDPGMDMACRMYGHIPVVRRATGQSDATAQVGWTLIEDLTN